MGNMTRPFEYRWTFLGGPMIHYLRAKEVEPGIIRYFDRREGENVEAEVENPCGLTNEFVHLVQTLRDLRCQLAATGTGPSSCSECDDYDAEAIAACPHCQNPVCDACMHNWHTNGICCPEG